LPLALGDWVVKGGVVDYYPVSPKAFAANFDAVPGPFDHLNPPQATGLQSRWSGGFLGISGFNPLSFC